MPNKDDDLGFVPDSSDDSDLGFVPDEKAAPSMGQRFAGMAKRALGPVGEAGKAMLGPIADDPLGKIAELSRYAKSGNKMAADLARKGGIAGRIGGGALEIASDALLPEGR